MSDDENPSLPFDEDLDDTLELADFVQDTADRTEAAPIDEAEADDSGHAEDEWHAGPSIFDEFTNDDYVAATTTEYQGLAEAVLESETQTHELQAVAAHMPGIEGGLVGFEDVTDEVVAAPPLVPSDLPARIITAVVLLGLVLASLWAGGGWFVILVTAVAVLALGEFYVGVRRLGYVPVALFGLLGTIAAMAGGWLSGPGGIAGSVGVFVMFILLWYSVLVRRNPLQNAAITIFGFVWIAGLLGFAAAIAASDEYVALIVGLVLIAAALDVGSYFAGRAFGRRQLAPVLSPKKTVEGLIGGIAVSALVAVVVATIPFFDPIELTGALWLAGAVAVVSPIGDLAESMVKRSLGLKDMGSILPGHGGLLDRIDGLLFAVPMGYFVFSVLEYL